jgi:hypothetical protein
MKLPRSLIAASLLLSPMLAAAGSLNCGVAGTAPYCQYDGRVSRAYVNAYDQILLYFGTDFGTAGPTQVGLAATTGAAAIVSMVAKPEFAKMFYASLLTAQAQGKTITVQMYGVSGGYLQVDRIWVNDY